MKYVNCFGLSFRIEETLRFSLNVILIFLPLSKATEILKNKWFQPLENCDSLGS